MREAVEALRYLEPGNVCMGKGHTHSFLSRVPLQRLAGQLPLLVLALAAALLLAGCPSGGSGGGY